MKKKVRLDQLLVEKELAETRSKARAMILAGDVQVDDTLVTKAGAEVLPDAEISIRTRSRYVGRGGDKIAPILDRLQITVAGTVALDVGSSTGGFTDALLQRGAKKVYAVDVGHNQLSYKLKQDERVVVMEKTDIRSLTPAAFSEQPQFVVVDVSFISVRKILSVVCSLVGSSAEMLVLVKPQFELEAKDVAKGGIVRDPALQERAVLAVCQRAEELGLEHLATRPAALAGAKKGNQEYFLHLRLVDKTS